MPLITKEELENASADANSLSEFTNASENTTVVTRLGKVFPSLAKLIKAIYDQTSVILTGIGYAPPVTYASGINLTSPSQTVFYNGVVYAPLNSALPFVTTGTFETAKFRVIQNSVSASDLAADTGTSLIKYRLNGTGSVSRTLRDKLSDSINVKDFGAIADCTGYGQGTDNRPFFQAALDYANPRGLDVIVPAGKYRIGAPGLSVNNTSNQGLESFRTSLRGDGPRGSILMGDSGDFNMVAFRGQGNNTGSYSQQHINEIAVLKADIQGACIYLDNHYHASMTNVRTNGGRYGLLMYDVHESCFTNVVVTFALYGVYANKNVFTQPNILSFYNCSISNCRNYGLDIHNPATFTYIGGSIEGNQPIAGASPDPDPVRWGCRLIWDDSVGEGTAGATFIGTYFEQNDGKADLWFSNANVASTLTLVGCSFQRHTISTTNCILFEAGSNTTTNYTLSLMGNGFRGYTEFGYTPSASKKYIAISDTTRNIKVVDIGNNYYHAIEKPNFSALGPHITQEAMFSAAVRTSSNAGTIAQSFNVASVVRTGVGLYTINYARALTSVTNIYSYMIIGGISGYATIVAESTTSVSIAIRTFADVAQDAPFSLNVSGGSGIAG